MGPIVTDRVAWFVGLSVCLLQQWYLQKRLNRSRCRLAWGFVLTKEPSIRWGSRSPMRRGNLKGESGLLQSIATFCCELCKNGWTDRDAVWDLDSGGPKEACNRWGCTLAPPGEYQWTVHMRRRCGLSYFLLSKRQQSKTYGTTVT